MFRFCVEHNKWKLARITRNPRVKHFRIQRGGNTPMDIFERVDVSTPGAIVKTKGEKSNQRVIFKY